MSHSGNDSKHAGIFGLAVGIDYYKSLFCTLKFRHVQWNNLIVRVNKNRTRRTNTSVYVKHN